MAASSRNDFLTQLSSSRWKDTHILIGMVSEHLPTESSASFYRLPNIVFDSAQRDNGTTKTRTSIWEDVHFDSSFIDGHALRRSSNRD